MDSRSRVTSRIRMAQTLRGSAISVTSPYGPSRRITLRGRRCPRRGCRRRGRTRARCARRSPSRWRSCCRRRGRGTRTPRLAVGAHIEVLPIAASRAKNSLTPIHTLSLAFRPQPVPYRCRRILPRLGVALPVKGSMQKTVRVSSAGFQAEPRIPSGSSFVISRSSSDRRSIHHSRPVTPYAARS